ncbi:MAG: cytidine deaminase [Bryobacterales bacterium]|nr:cytidine deaminase [Bryobacterales bacterium]
MDPLTQAAIGARAHAHAPYSNFHVGAALETDDGRIFTGCNVESASYGLTMCAERVAAFHAVSQGARIFKRIAVATGVAKPAPPCGACRQVIWDLCGDIDVILVSANGTTETFRLSQLLPRPFDDHSMA